MYSPSVNALVRFFIKRRTLISRSFHQDPAATGGMDNRCHARMTTYGIHAYIRLTNWSQLLISPCYNYCMMNNIRHNHPSPIQCLRVLSYWSSLRYFGATAVTAAITLLLLLLLCCYWLLLLLLLSYYLATDTLLLTLNLSGVIELTTQVLILENIISLPLESNQ